MSGAHCSPYWTAKEEASGLQVEEASGLQVEKRLCHSQRSQRRPRGVFFSLLWCVQLCWTLVHPPDWNFWRRAAGVRRAAGACAVAAGRLLSARRLRQSAPHPRGRASLPPPGGRREASRGGRTRTVVSKRTG